MVYNIERKTDLSGTMLIIRFPERDLDKKALYTIENDSPPFLIPFTYRKVDGMIECAYRPGNRSKLQYSFGARGTAAYIELWGRVLQPLLDCGDWFLKPFSFVMDVRELYTDKQGGIGYLYIPTLPDCESFEALHGFVAELSRQNSVTDATLENKVLRMIMQDFQPKSFLAMLYAYSGGEEKPARQAVQQTQPEQQVRQEQADGAHLFEQFRPNTAPEQEPERAERTPEQKPILAGGNDDIQIQFPSQDKKEEKKHKQFFGGKKEKPPKPVKEKERKPLFGGKKSAEREIILGAAAESRRPERLEVRPQVSYEEPEDAVTQLEDLGTGVCCLRLMSAMQLPQEIIVDIQPGQAFTIGRFDISVGRKQSSFEFPKETKAVSRRHAAIERDTAGGYALVDLASSAGTFVNGERLIPNVPCSISGGCRISFGTGGADYIWNE